MRNKVLFLGILLIIIFLPLILLIVQSKQELRQRAAGVNEFLTRLGNIFLYHGQPIALYGTTIYTSQGNGAPNYTWTSSNFPQRIDYDLNLAQQAHFNVIRPTDETNSASDDPYNPIVWQNMDYLIQETAKRNMFVELDLSTFAHNLINKGINPFDPTIEPQWQKYITFVVSRYKSTPNIAFFKIMGEVNPVNSTAFPKSTTQGYLDFYTRTTNDVYAIDLGNHMIAAGGLSHLNDPNSGIPWQQIFSLPHVDMATIHVYAANPLDPINTSNDLHITVPMIGTWALQNNKPAVIEEYGFVQQIGDAQRASDIQIIQQAAIKNGYRGLFIWNLGPEVLGGLHYDVNPNYPITWQQIITGILPSPILSPTIFPSLSATIQPTLTPTPSSTSSQTPIPTTTNPIKHTQLQVTIFLHDIGKGGDNANPNGGGTQNPKHQIRQITILLIDNNNQIATLSGQITYQAVTGNFTGLVDAQTIPNGTYTILINTEGYLRRRVGVVQISHGNINIIPTIYEVSGDINNDNKLDLLDYSALIDCYEAKLNSISCHYKPNLTYPGADIMDDDGIVDGIDYNALLREVSVQPGTGD